MVRYKSRTAANKPMTLYLTFSRWCRQLLGIGCLSVLLHPASTIAAEKISFVYSPLEFSISVSSLEKFAQTGIIDSELATYARFAKPGEMAELWKILNVRLDLGVVSVAQFLYSSFGETSLRFLGELIQTEAHQNGFYAIRAALILAAADPEGLTLLNVLKKFPTQTVQINSDSVLQVVRGFTDLYRKTQEVLQFVDRQFEVEATQAIPESNLVSRLNQRGKWTWTQETLSINDRRRQRSFTVELYRPQRQGSIPTLIISPGLGASRVDFAELAEHLASHGFAIALIDHSGSNQQQIEALLAGKAREVVNASEFIDRPLDVSYLLDELQRRQRSIAQPGSLNLQNVGVIGHSFGGYTAFALAGAAFDLAALRKSCESSQINLNVGNISLLLQCLAINLPAQTLNRLRDPRVQAVVTINPIGSQVFGQRGISQLQIPVMLIGGTEDAIAPVLPEQICPFHWLTTPNKYLVLIEKGTHTYTNRAVSQTDPFNAPELASPNPVLARLYLNTLSLAFVETYLLDSSIAKSSLQASYAHSISRSPLLLKLIRSLTIPQAEIARFCPYPTMRHINKQNNQRW